MSQSRTSANGRSSVSVPTVVPGLHVKVKFSNNLPDIPFDPKFLVNPLSLSRFVDYETTTLEKNAKHELLTPMDLGVDIDLILPERYAIPPHIEHDPEDERLLNDDEPLTQLTKKSPRDKPHSQLHNKVVPWLKKTEYISTEYNRYGSSNEKTETKVGYNVRKNIKEEEIFLDRENQIKAINQTFEAAKKPIENHPTKPGVYAKQVLPLLPDFNLWKYMFAFVKFDNEPADSSRAHEMSQAIMKGAVDNETNDHFVIYFLPTEVTMTDRLLDQHNGLEYTEGKEYEYKSTREYNWLAKSNPESDHFFFVFRPDGVYYNRLPMDVTLKKRRNKSSNQSSSTLVVKYREPTELEVNGHDERLKQLSRPKQAVVESMDLTAQSLEQSYEDMNQERQQGGDDDKKLVLTPGADQASSQDDSTSASSSSASTPASSEADSSSSSSSEDEDDKEKDDDDDEDDDDDDDD